MAFHDNRAVSGGLTSANLATKRLSKGKGSRPLGIPLSLESMIKLFRSARLTRMLTPLLTTATELLGPAKSLTQRRRPLNWPSKYSSGSWGTPLVGGGVKPSLAAAK